MTANINTRTGYPYGVMQGNSSEAANQLLQDIFDRGTNETYASYMRDLDRHIEKLRGVVYKEEMYAQEAVSGILVALDLHIRLPADYYDEDTRTIDVDFVQDLVADYINTHADFDECEYTLKTKNATYMVSWLQGPLIWVLDSNYVAACRPCSPCVPGAGDLDSAEYGGSWAHCPDPEDFDYHETDFLQVMQLHGDTLIPYFSAHESAADG